ncbi:MAG: hypothetical protein N2204_04290, partial [Anaerolineae bacterium]|nr:hypothetical protein [Anaerolineae bacterium]
PGKPLPAAVEAYFNQKSGPEARRVYRNNLLALAPEVSRMAGLREQVRRYLGWARLERPEHFKLLTASQKKGLPRRKQEVANSLPEAVVAAYHILVAVDEEGRVRAQALRSYAGIGGAPFERIKAMLADEERLLTTTLDPDLILPGSYLRLWGEGQTARRVADLLAAFGQFPRLPRLLRPEVLYDTLKRGVREGALVLRLPRADGSARTWWRLPPDDEDTLRRPELEVQPARQAELHHLEPELLMPDRLPGLWPAPTGPLALADVLAFFDGTRAPRLAVADVLERAVRAAVETGRLMAVVGVAAFWREPLPSGNPSDGWQLWPAPAPLRGADLTPQALPDAWQGGETTAQALAAALAGRRRYPIPWTLLREGVDDALRLRLFEPASGSSPWPCSPALAGEARFRPVERIEVSPEMIESALNYTSAIPTVAALQEAIQTYFVRREVPTEAVVAAVEAAIRRGLLAEADERHTLGTAANPLTVRVRRPAAALLAEAMLDPAALQRLAERVERLLLAAPELAFTFRVALAAEGERPDAETLARLNALLAEVQPGWRLE